MPEFECMNDLSTFEIVTSLPLPNIRCAHFNIVNASHRFDQKAYASIIVALEKLLPSKIGFSPQNKISVKNWYSITRTRRVEWRVKLPQYSNDVA